MKCNKIALLLCVVGILSPAVSFAKKQFSQIETDTQIVSEQLVTKLGKKSLAYKDSKWSKDIASRKVDLANIPEEVLQKSVGWIKTMIKEEWQPKDIKTKWLKGLRKEEHPAADYLILRYKVDGCKIQVQENGSATRILIEDPNSISSDQNIENYIVHTIYKFLNYPVGHKNSFKFYIKDLEHGNKKIYYGKFNCGFDSKDKCNILAKCHDEFC